MNTNETLVYCYTPVPVYKIGSDQSALIIAIIFICVVLIVTLYAVNHKFFDPYLEKTRNNLCKGTSAVEPHVSEAAAFESQPLSNSKSSHVVVNPVNPINTNKDSDYATSQNKAKSTYVKVESRHEDTIAESVGHLPGTSTNKSATNNEIGKNNNNSEADF
jgi:hypothetical protein